MLSRAQGKYLLPGPGKKESAMELSRRKFLGSSGAAMVAGTITSRLVYGANEKMGACVIGMNRRGGSHISGFTNSEYSEVVALCDPDRLVLERRAKEVLDETGKRAKLYSDIRDALADDAVDVVGIATPNHWHTLATIWACQAGKDVYVEKPATHNVWEGRQIQAAAKKYGRIVMHGTQSRSSDTWLRDIPLLQSGEIIGPLHTVRGLCFKTKGSRDSIGFAEDSAPPDHLDWRLWQGPATEQSYNPNYVHYKWHWFWDYGNGEIMNQGIHQIDVAVWAMNKGMPVKVFSEGGRYTYTDQGQTPNTNVATMRYADGTMMVFEVRNRYTNDESGVNVGNLFYGSDGYYVQNKGFFDKENNLIELDEKKYPKPETLGQWGNFIRAVQSRKESDIYGTMENAHISCAHGHLANVSYRVGRSIVFDPKTESIVDDPEANKLLRREYEPGFEVPELA